MKHNRLIPALAAFGIAAAGLSGCGGDDDKPTDAGSAPASDAPAPSTASTDVKGTVNVLAAWSAAEQKSFQAVIDEFEKKYTGVTVKYKSGGDNTATLLNSQVEGGSPPDVAAVAQPGTIKEFQEKGALQPLDFAEDTVKAEYSEDIAELGQIDGKQYSFVFKAANKSTVWYNTAAFTDAGVQPPATWEDFLKNAETLGGSGVPAYSLGGSDGWTLTDLFENVYLRLAGPEKYDQLSDHEIPWTDQSVKDTLTEMAKIFSDTENIVGGAKGATGTDFPTSVENVFTDPAKGAQVIEGDFVPGVVADKTKLKPVEGYNVFDFPSVNGSAPAVVGGGDSVVLFTKNEAAQAFVEYLASAEAQTVWAKRGGFSSANKSVDTASYPDELSKKTAGAIASAETFRFDMSDLAPAAFGGTPGQGEWKALQDFLADPADVDGAAEALEKAAAKAYKTQQ